ncbi:MAG: hypothetical protein HY695_05420 [Deltaproteobacteria bacterium]|nr:hypothetical protein [Deltaproteobacteria bacterium]
MKAAARSPSPRNGLLVNPTAGNRMRGLSKRAAAFISAERPKGESRGRPMSAVRLDAAQDMPFDAAQDMLSEEK